MFGLGMGEIVIILLLAVVFIGPKKLPELARSLGKSLREFQKAKDEILHNIKNPEEDFSESSSSTASSVDAIPKPAQKEESPTKDA